MESQKSVKLKSYQKKLKKLLDRNILDIILFGSFVKGGIPNDTDVAIIVRNKERLEEIKKKIRSVVKKPDIEIIDIESIYNSTWLTLIKEGFSVNKNKFIYELYNIKPSVLFKYSLKKLTNVQKVQFERGLKNVLKSGGTVLTRSVILVPIKIKSEVEDFLKSWNIYYESQEYELLPLMRKESFL
ncbi:MAG: hypothetical protein ABII01_04640 [Candidatus Woesearchaeota archaeon]